MQCEALVQESVVRAQQLGEIAIALEDTADEQLQLALKVSDQIGGIVGKQIRVGVDELQAVHVQPLEGEVGHQGVGAWVRQKAAHLLFQHGRPMKLAACSQPNQLLVGRPAPQEERQPRSEIRIAQAILGARRKPRRRLVGAIQEFGTDQDRHQPFANAGVEAAGAATVGIELQGP